jgi:hypothetical protein
LSGGRPAVAAHVGGRLLTRRKGASFGNHKQRADAEFSCGADGSNRNGKTGSAAGAGGGEHGAAGLQHGEDGVSVRADEKQGHQPDGAGVFRFTVQDKNLAGRIARLIAEHEEQKKREAAPYQERLSRAIAGLPERTPVGFVSWYGVMYAGQYIRRDDFKAGEDMPCLMRGAIWLLSKKYRGMADYPVEVVERFVRRKKITCVNPSVWRELVNQNMARLNKLARKYGAATSYSFDGRIYDFVKFLGDGDAEVLINGESHALRREKYEQICLLHENLEKLAGLEIRL